MNYRLNKKSHPLLHNEHRTKQKGKPEEHKISFIITNIMHGNKKPAAMCVCMRVCVEVKKRKLGETNQEKDSH